MFAIPKESILQIWKELLYAGPKIGLHAAKPTSK